MTTDSIKKIIKEQGVAGAVLHYGARFLSKAEKQVIGRFAKRFCKTRENLLVFKNRQGLDFTDNPRAFFEYLTENGYQEKYEMVWLVSDPGAFKGKKYKNVKFVTAENRYGWNSCRAYYYAATAKYFFYTHNTEDLLDYGCSGRTVVNLWHGCGYKGAEAQGKRSVRTSFDYGLVPGPLFAKTKAAAWNCEKEKILTLGYPRYDWMLHPGLSREEALWRLFRKKARAAVIWMPTFRKSVLGGCREGEIQLPYQLPALESEEELKELDGFLKQADMLLIIKKHPLQTGWMCREQGFSNVCYVTEELLAEAGLQLYQLLGLMDGLISDYSSAAVDFMLLDRPIAYVLTDFSEYKEKRGFVFQDPLVYMPGEKVYDGDGIRTFLTHVMEGKDLYKEERAALMPVMHNPAKNYSRRLADRLGL